jgi:glycerol-3-phosphate acyltransferase PlsY
MLFYVLVACTIGFLSGSILWSYLLGKMLYHIDIREYGSDKNPGAMNAFHARGPSLGIPGALLDVLKSFVPVHCFIYELSFSFSPLEIGFIAVSPILGHVFTPLFKGKGGKGVAATIGAWFALGFIHMGIALGIIFASGELLKSAYTAFTKRPVDDAFVVVFGFFVFVVYLYAFYYQFFTAGLMNLGVLIYGHRRELRLRRGLVQQS